MGFRRIRVLWPWCIWKRRYLQRNAPACRKRQTLLCWRGDQHLSCVRQFTFSLLSVLLTRILSIAGLRVLWTAHGVPLTNTYFLINLRAFRRSSGSCGARPSTGMKLPTRNWSNLTGSSRNDTLLSPSTNLESCSPSLEEKAPGWFLYDLNFLVRNP